MLLPIFQYIGNQDLQTQDYLFNIDKWTDNQKMIINQKKTKTMIINFTKNMASDDDVGPPE